MQSQNFLIHSQNLARLRKGFGTPPRHRHRPRRTTFYFHSHSSTSSIPRSLIASISSTSSSRFWRHRTLRQFLPRPSAASDCGSSFSIATPDGPSPGQLAGHLTASIPAVYAFIARSEPARNQSCYAEERSTRRACQLPPCCPRPGASARSLLDGFSSASVVLSGA